MRYILSAFLCAILLSGCSVKANQKPLETTAIPEITDAPLESETVATR